MDADCEDRLLEIQYFAAREWSMDAHLVEACDADARRICHTGAKWWERKPDAQTANQDRLVISCLYRHAIEPLDDKIDPESPDWKV
jgi:Golgi apparatus protein 1